MTDTLVLSSSDGPSARSAPDLSRVQPTSPTPRAATPSGREAIIQNVDIVVETYLAASSMTISALDALKAGDLVNLDAALNQPVELRVNGVAIASGELVAVGDKFAVRVIAVAP